MLVRAVTDSTGDTPPELARERRIQVASLPVRFGGEAFRDGVELGPPGEARSRNHGCRPRGPDPVP